jgi:hypothetical protein
MPNPNLKKEVKMIKKLTILVIFLLSSIPNIVSLSNHASAQGIDTAWVRTYYGLWGQRPDGAKAITLDGSGNVIVTGQSGQDDLWPYNFDYATIKYYSNGDFAWVRRYNGPGNDEDIARAIVADGSGNIYVTGESSAEFPHWKDYATIKYYPNGDTAWVRRYDGPTNNDDEAYAIAIDGSGNVYVTGTSIGPNEDYATIKYHSNGDTAWVRRYDCSGDIDGASAIAVDDSENVYVTGSSRDGDGYNDYATIKYYPSGDTAWVRRHSSLSLIGYAGANAIAVDVSGNVYVTGSSEGSGLTWDYATIKYYPNGDTAWVRRYNGPGNDDDYARAIAIDGSGNVYVTGHSIGIGTSYDYATIKYYPNGDTAWVRRYNGPVNGADYCFAIVVDGSGNVYVTGYSAVWYAFSDYTTIKYFPNGDIAWVRRYNGMGNNDDYCYDITVDGSGNVYVTGSTYSGYETSSDYTTIKYLPFAYVPYTLDFFAFSPVDLIVTDPKGDSIGLDFNTISNATYDTTLDINLDGDLDDIVTIPNPLVGQYMVKVKSEPGADTGHYSLTIKLNGNEDKPLALNLPIPPPDQVDTFTYTVYEYLRGDPNSDGKKTVSDVIYLINYLFKGGPAPVPLYLGDVNCDDKVTVSDVIYLINYLFKGGDPPCS